MDETEKRAKAWVGDAVLALFARSWILEQSGIAPEERSATFISMTSNQFLADFGEPTHMEAQIGIVYEKEGLQAAFDYIETTFLPTFLKQQANKSKGVRGHKRRKQKPAKK